MSLDEFDQHQSRNEEAMRSAQQDYESEPVYICNGCKQSTDDCPCPRCIECDLIKDECTCPPDVKALAEKKEKALFQLEVIQLDASTGASKWMPSQLQREQLVLERLIIEIKIEQSSFTLIDRKIGNLNQLRHDALKREDTLGAIICTTKISTLVDLKKELKGETANGRTSTE